MKYLILTLILATTAFAEPPDNLLDAIEFVESRGQSDAVGDKGNAVGAYQIWKIYVDDVNRILGQDKYSYDDRWDKGKSREMVRVYLRHYGKGSLESMARIHNGGPNGWKKESTKKYWLKVKARMEAQ